jgi:type II secretory pathway pseudopilin PulG
MLSRLNHQAADEGITLIEVLVAMMVFAIIAVGVAYGLITALYLGNDARSRETATNLAAQEIDLARATSDVFAVVDNDKTVVQNGTTFRLQRVTSWITTTNPDGICGSGGGQLRYKRVNVTVTWDSMRASTRPVRADSALAPGTKLNDPAFGTILVSVLTAAGTGASGVAVSAVPASIPNGAATLTVAPVATDAQGCSYVLKVKPGNYAVSIARSNYLDRGQSATPATTVSVMAGGAASVSFSYDLAQTITANYAPGFLAGTLLIPSNLDTTFRSSYGLYTPGAVTNATSVAFRLHPFGAGYEVFAGKYVAASSTSAGCLSVDPAEWITPAADGAIGSPAPRVGTVPGGAASVNMRMGVVMVSGLSGKYLRAVSQTGAATTGDPGCAVAASYTFGLLPAGLQAQIALPFGSWNLYSGDTATSQTVAVPAAQLTVVSRGGPVAADGIVTLDPRMVVLP